MSRNKRNVHSGRSRKEFENYYRNINDTSSESTLKQSNTISDFSSTSSSEKQDESYESSYLAYRKDSNGIKIKKWFYENIQFVLVTTVVGILITWLFTLYVGNNREIGEHSVKISAVEKDLGKLSDDIKDLSMDNRNLEKIIVIIQNDHEHLEKDFQELKNVISVKSQERIKK